MTREEAIKCLKTIQRRTPEWDDREDGLSYWDAIDMALSAIRPVSREQVEKSWRGEWIGMTDDDGCTWQECSRCEHDLDSMEEAQNFCPACGAPMTDEAVDIRLKELEALNDGKGD